MRKLLVILFILAACGEGRLSPQGGTVTGVSAGNGLTGGGTSGSLTLNVGCGTGLTCAADSISVNTTTVITGTISNNTLAKGNSSNGLQNSLVTDDATTLAYNTNKFTVASSTGNTLIAGTLGATGVVTATAGVTTPANLTTTGTGDLVSADDLTVADDATITDILTVNGNVNLGNAAGDFTTISGIARGFVEDTYFAWDNAGSDRLGFVKKTGSSPKVAFGSGITFSIASSSGTSIDAAGTFTDRLTITAAGAVAIPGSLNVVGAITENSARVYSAVAGNGLTSSGATVRIRSDCSDGQILISTSGNWNCGANGTVTPAIQDVSTTGTINNQTLNSDTTVLNFTGGTTITLTGITGGTDGRVLYIYNRGSSTISITRESAGSTATNRIWTPDDGTPLVINKRTGIVLHYDNDANAAGDGRWLVDTQGTRVRSFTVDSTFTASASATLGTSGTDTLTVNSAPTFQAAAVFNHNVTIGDATTDTLTVTSAMDVNNDLTKFGATTDGAVYMGTTSLNFAYATNAAADGIINAVGYQNGTTQFRNLKIQDGKGADIVTVTGTTKAVSLAGGLTTSGSITDNGNLTVLNDTTLGDADTDVFTTQAILGFSGGSPTINSCGTSPSVSGEAQSFQLTVGSGITSCVVNFNRTFTSAPYCTFSPANAQAALDIASTGSFGDSPRISSATNTVTLTFDANTENAPIYNVSCFDRR